MIAHFLGAKGISTFDLRAGVKELAYYDLHHYQITDFDAGKDTMSDYAISAGSTQKLRYDVRPINLTKSTRDQDASYEIYPGHQAMITKMRLDGENIVTAAKNGELKIMKFNLFKGDLNKAPSCISIRN